MSKKGVAEAKSSGVVVGAGTGHGLHLISRIKKYGLYAAILLVVVAIGIGAYAYKKHADRLHKEAVAKQQALQKKAADPNSVGDMHKLKADSENLIKGAANGTYDVSDEELAVAYINRADTALNAKDYKAAAADYKKAAELDSSQKTAAQYGEFVARYRQGERKELIPLLEALKKPLQDNHESLSQRQFATYEQYIADLQAGKDLEL